MSPHGVMAEEGWRSTWPESPMARPLVVGTLLGQCSKLLYIFLVAFINYHTFKTFYGEKYFLLLFECVEM